MRFAVDTMLGKLARWLRALGYDAAYDPGCEDASLLRLAREEGRVLLTRDTRLLLRRDLPQALFVRSDRLEEQVAQVRRELGPEAERDSPFSRCLECNGELVEAPPEEVRDLVPPYVYSTQKQFARCAGCGRIYWKGTHFPRIQQKIAKLQQAGGNV
jgi:hypothetical protein